MSYGRNFEFRVAPRSGEREGRFYVESATLIGAPVVVADDANPVEHERGLVKVELATGAQAPRPGLSGICVYEHLDLRGSDPAMTTYSDIDTAPAGAAVQVVRGDSVKVALHNTDDRTFLNTREYTGRVMVAGGGATPTLAIGDFLTPGPGTDEGGFWAETSDEAEAWLVVTGVDPARNEVEARMLF